MIITLRRPLARLATLVALASLFVTLHAQAARPFVTDDARLTTAGSCQLESWIRIYPESRESWALPGCNPGGNLELTLGGGKASYAGETATRDDVVQLKTLFRELSTNSWGIGLALGTIRHVGATAGPNQFGATYGYLPISVSHRDDAFIMHYNLGMLRERSGGRNNLTWGIGAEIQALPRLIAIAEAFGDNHANPYWQAGARYAIVPNRVQVDATFGRQLGGPAAGRWMSFGLRLTPERLF